MLPAPLFSDAQSFPLVIVPLQGDHAQCLAQAAALRGSGAHLLEWRLDTDPTWLDDAAAWAERAAAYRAAAGLPVLATIRTTREGGEAEVDDSTYAGAVLRLAECCEAVDFEGSRGPETAARLRQVAARAGCAVIASSHNFQTVPADDQLDRTLSELHQRGDVVKIAVMPAQEADVSRLGASARRYASRADAKPAIVIAMGELGRQGRLEPASLGSCATFACADKSSAPGQVPVGQVVAALNAQAAR
ncbi:type I 3-dehydroquinate dehydratase [Buchananella felis]|uniref:type I 3-dehydroquinate dehydratase n=1 Tax=Buchananella felis TaxID=3231492 RepID=UPI0035276FD5